MLIPLLVAKVVACILSLKVLCFQNRADKSSPNCDAFGLSFALGLVVNNKHNLTFKMC